MSNITREIESKERYERRLTEYVSELTERSRKEALDRFAEGRRFPIEAVQQAGIFYIGEMAEMLIPRYLDELYEFGVISPTNRKPIFHNRYIIPIKNENGLVQNLVGYSHEANERYIYGTALYYNRRETLWGLENLELAYDLGYAIITEGITDAIRLRSMGYMNTFATCGTHKSEFIMRQLNRCRHGIIRIPDRDDAGIRALKNWECNRHLTVYINFAYKDVDEMCAESDENREWFNDYMRDCINWITSEEHRGHKSLCESITIL